MHNKFLQHIWYAFAWSSEVTTSPLGRTVADTNLVAFRDQSGQLHLLEDRCPHRFLPLHLGKIVDNNLQCAYHGLRFNGDGKCVLNPHGTGAIAASLHLRRFPALERHRLIWCWLGPADLADPASIPDFSHLENPAYATAADGYLHTKCNYELYTDNLLDLSHAQFLHPTTLGSAAIAGSPVEVVEQGSTILVNRFCPDAPAAPRYEQLLQAGDRHVDHWIDMRWNAPASMLLDVGATLTGATRAAGVNIKATHIVTPETATTSHYFYASSRDFEIDDETITTRSRAVQQHAFTHEDKPILEAQQNSIGSVEFMSLKPTLLSCDIGAARVRRTLQHLLAQEPTHPPAPPRTAPQ